MKITQIDSIEAAVQTILTKIVDKEIPLDPTKPWNSKDFRVGAENREVEVEYQGRINHNGAEKLKITINYETPVEIIVLYNASQEPNPNLVAHLNQKIRWSETLRDLNDNNKEGRRISDYLTPMGYGDRSPVTHYWSEFVGEMITTRLSENSSHVNLIASKLASALTATNKNIEEILGASSVQENGRKVNALLPTAQPDLKKFLLNYLDYTCSRLSAAKQKYESIPESIYKKSVETKAKLDAFVEEIKTQKALVLELRTELQKPETTFDSYSQQDYVLIHPDITNFDNILIDKKNEIWFIDGILPETRTLDSYFGPRQIYYYVFKEHFKEWGNPAEIDIPSRTRAHSLSLIAPMLGNLCAILEKEYHIGAHKEDKLIERAISSYFTAGGLRRKAEEVYKKLLGIGLPRIEDYAPLPQPANNV
ncbi:MAG: hypothetical protein NTY99_02840 [DPANN group archaeon]|nr:hypothetical protein [DPANN group archaeon]